MNENQQQTNIWKEGMFMKVQLYIDEKFSEEKVRFMDPLTDGIVLPILHLNGYKIANPTILVQHIKCVGMYTVTK